MQQTVFLWPGGDSDENLTVEVYKYIYTIGNLYI